MSHTKPTVGKDPRMKIGVLEEASGVSRDTIHFYVRSGLLHKPNKAGATVAYYDEAHLERLRRIRTLRAQGLPLPMIRRLLADEGARLSSDDLELVGRVLASTERPEAPRTGMVPEGVRELSQSLGLTHQVECDSRLAMALGVVADLPGPMRDFAKALLGSVVSGVRDSVTREQRLVAGWLGGVGDLRRSADELREVQSAVRGVASAVRDALVRDGMESTLLAVVDALGALRVVPVWPLGAEQSASAMPWIRTLEGRATEGDREAYGVLARVMFGVGLAKKLGEVCKRARRAGVHDAWVCLGPGVSALEAGEIVAAREGFARALSERPGWGLAAVYAATAGVLGAGREGTGFFRGAFAAIRALDEAVPSGDDPEVVQLWTLLVKARALVALPEMLGRAGVARRIATECVERAENHRAVSEAWEACEWARARGNAWMALADACRAAGDARSEAEALGRLAGLPGPMGVHARARLTSTGATS